MLRRIRKASVALTDTGFHVSATLLPGHPDNVIAADVKGRGIGLLAMGASLVRTCRVPVLLFR